MLRRIETGSTETWNKGNGLIEKERKGIGEKEEKWIGKKDGKRLEISLGLGIARSPHKVIQTHI